MNLCKRRTGSKGAAVAAKNARLEVEWRARVQASKPCAGEIPLGPDGRPIPAFARAAGAARAAFDDGRGVFSPKKGGDVMQMAADDAAGGGKGGVGTTPKGISKALYDKLRKQTPSNAIRKLVNKNAPKPPYDDPALPKLKVTGNLEADHIVPMKTITEMNGFDKLSEADQVKVLNYENNFVGLSKTANTSKGAQSFSDWTEYKKLDMQVDPTFRQTMIQKEQDMTVELQKYIDSLPKTQ